MAQWSSNGMERELVSLWVSCEHVLEFGIPIGSFFFFTILVSVWIQIFCLVSAHPYFYVMQMHNVYLASILSFEYLELRKYILFRKYTSMKQETVDLSHASLIS